jgi:hypothetical protein
MQGQWVGRDQAPFGCTSFLVMKGTNPYQHSYYNIFRRMRQTVREAQGHAGPAENNRYYLTILLNKVYTILVGQDRHINNGGAAWQRSR